MKSFLKNTVVFVALVVSCGREASENALSSRLVGKWRNMDMKITMNSYKNSDSSRVLEVKEENWEKQMHIRPIQTTFGNDGSYNSPHYDLKDSLFYNPSGKWMIRGDTIVMEDTFPKRGMKYKYRIRIVNDIAEFSSMEDSDNDGKADDHYFGRQRRMRK